MANVAIDLFTRYAVGVPLPDQRAETVANAILHNWILVFGPPKNLHSDQGTNFESDLIQNLCAAFRIGKSRTTPFHPQGNGACERLNATIKKGLNKVLSGKSPEFWDNALRHVLFTYNSCVHTVTRQTPFSLMFGEEPRIFAAVLAGPRPDAPPQAYASRPISSTSSSTRPMAGSSLPSQSGCRFRGTASC
jgi:hypothetical protein